MSKLVPGLLPSKSTLAILVVLLFTSVAVKPARADTIETFNASGIFASGSALSGTISIDQTTGLVSAADLMVGAPDSLNFTFGRIQEYNSVAAAVQVDLGIAATGDPTLNLLLPSANASNLIGYNGGAIFSLSDLSGGRATSAIASSIGFEYLEQGTLSPVVPVPEPSTFLLLGTGLLGLAGLARLKLA